MTESSIADDDGNPSQEFAGFVRDAKEFKARSETIESDVSRADQEQRDRSWIARRVIALFTWVVVGAFLVLFVQGFLSGDWPAVATQTSELTRSTVLPIVTLILGYYFGRSGRS